MSVSMRNPPQRRRSLGPVSPKRIYRNLSVRLRGGEASVAGEMDPPKHLGKSADAVRYLFWCRFEAEVCSLWMKCFPVPWLGVSFKL